MTYKTNDTVLIEDGYAGAPHLATVVSVSVNGVLYAESADRIPWDSRSVGWTIPADLVQSMVSHA